MRQGERRVPGWDGQATRKSRAPSGYHGSGSDVQIVNEGPVLHRAADSADHRRGQQEERIGPGLHALTAERSRLAVSGRRKRSYDVLLVELERERAPRRGDDLDACRPGSSTLDGGRLGFTASAARRTARPRLGGRTRCDLVRTFTRRRCAIRIETSWTMTGGLWSRRVDGDDGPPWSTARRRQNGEGQAPSHVLGPGHRRTIRSRHSSSEILTRLDDPLRAKALLA